MLINENTNARSTYKGVGMMFYSGGAALLFHYNL